MSLGAARSLFFLLRLTFRRQLLSRKTGVAALFLSLIAGLVILGRLVGPWEPANLLRWGILELFGGFFVPIAALAYGNGALGDDRDEKSLVHLLSRPLPRTGIYLAKLFAALLLTLPFLLGGLWVLDRLSGIAPSEGVPRIFECLWPGIALSGLAYICLFQLLAAAFRHSTVISVAYVFFVEVFIGRMPGILKRISIHFYASSMALDRARPLGNVLSPREARIYLPLDAPTAAWVLAALAGILLIAGALIFARREYRDLT